MLIKCKQIRAGGSHVDIGGVNYHFAPDQDGNHVCDVTKSSHIARFLAIPEGYEIFDPEGESDSPDEDATTNEGNDNTDSGTQENTGESTPPAQAPAPKTENKKSNKGGPKESATGKDGVSVKKETSKPDAPELTPEELKQREMIIYATENLGIDNPQDPEQLVEYAKKKLGLNLPVDNMTVGELLQVILDHQQ